MKKSSVSSIQNSTISSTNFIENVRPMGRKEILYEWKDLGEKFPEWKADVTEKQELQWERVKDDSKNRCIEAVVRLLVIRGARNESIPRSKVLEVIASVDSSYKKHIDSILQKAQESLKESFGYCFCTGAEIASKAGQSNIQESSKDKIFVYNQLQNPKLLQILATMDRNSAFRGFTVAVFQALWGAPGHKIVASALLRHLRSIDRRFPETLNQTGNKRKKKSSPNSKSDKKQKSADDDEKEDDNEQVNQENDENYPNKKGVPESEEKEVDIEQVNQENNDGSSSEKAVPESDKLSSKAGGVGGFNYAIPELGGDFFSLMHRMEKEGYVIAHSDEDDKDDETKTVYSFGCRFFIEFGKRQVISSYFQGLGQDVDRSFLREIDEQVHKPV